MSPVRVIIADDHPILRSGIRGLLERAIDIEVVGEAVNGEEALQMVSEIAPDVLLLDMNLPVIKGMEVARRLQQSGSAVKVLILSAHSDPSFISELMEIGISGYLLKEEAPEVIVDAVRGVARGEQGWLSRSIAGQVLAILRGDESAGAKLTPREKQVLRLVVEGKTNQNIAVALKISEKTVEKYIGEIFNKLGVSSRTEAAVFAVREGLV
jgi:DNA-binding NarL/FixJ family response regulator